jgi:hypothetical protein
MRCKRRFGVDKERKKEQRRDVVRLAHPQEGVDLLRDAFPGATPFRASSRRERSRQPPASLTA